MRKFTKKECLLMAKWFKKTYKHDKTILKINGLFKDMTLGQRYGIGNMRELYKPKKLNKDD